MRIILIVIVLALAGCGAKPTASQPPANAPAVAPASVEAPLTMTGSGQNSGRPFPLKGGAYTVAWNTPANTDAHACFVGVTIDGTGPPPGSQITRSLVAVNKTIEPGGPNAGETSLYQVPAGEYFMNSKTSGTCSWSVTITPQ